VSLRGRPPREGVGPKRGAFFATRSLLFNEEIATLALLARDDMTFSIFS